MIAVVNSLSMHTTTQNSDIDFFIITEKNMIWWVRIWSIFLLKKSKMWRHGEDIAENICLSFFITKNAQNLNAIAITNDIYLYYWIYFLKPIWQKNTSYEDFLQQNTWVDIDMHQKKHNCIWEIHTENPPKTHWYHYFFNIILGFFMKKRAKYSYYKKWKPEGVIISNDMLKFHDKDQRKYVRNAVLNKKIFTKNF